MEGHLIEAPKCGTESRMAAWRSPKYSSSPMLVTLINLMMAGGGRLGRVGKEQIDAMFRVLSPYLPLIFIVSDKMPPHGTVSTDDPDPTATGRELKNLEIDHQSSAVPTAPSCCYRKALRTPAKP